VKRILKEEPMYDVLTKQVGEQAYVSRSGRIRVPELETYIFSTFEELGEADDGRPFVLYHGAVNTEEDGPVEVCVPKAAGDKLLPAGEVAFTEIGGTQCEFPEILGAYEAVYRWAKERGREPDGPPREIYVSAPDAELRMEIALPLR
jgi:effector-binding domain-containing protein